MGISDLELKLKSFKLKPQTPEQALETLKKMKQDLTLNVAKVNKKKLDVILKKAGSFTDEVLATRKKERA